MPEKCAYLTEGPCGNHNEPLSHIATDFVSPIFIAKGMTSYQSGDFRPLFDKQQIESDI